MSLRNTKSSSHDSIATKIKLYASYTCHLFTRIIKLSISDGLFRKQLKLFAVNPFFRKGDEENPSNQRPISLISTLSKVFERANF